MVIADDQRLLRTGFRVILDDEPDIKVVGEAPDGRTAVDVVLRRRPDVVLMDIRMPELDGLKAAESILSAPELDTAVLTAQGPLRPTGCWTRCASPPPAMPC